MVLIGRTVADSGGAAVWVLGGLVGAGGPDVRDDVRADPLRSRQRGRPIQGDSRGCHLVSSSPVSGRTRRDIGRMYTALKAISIGQCSLEPRAVLLAVHDTAAQRAAGMGAGGA